jgi:cytochrome c oxidase assembly factor CtaG
MVQLAGMSMLNLVSLQPLAGSILFPQIFFKALTITNVTIISSLSIVLKFNLLNVMNCGQELMNLLLVSTGMIYTDQFIQIISFQQQMILKKKDNSDKEAQW